MIIHSTISPPNCTASLAAFRLMSCSFLRAAFPDIDIFFLHISHVQHIGFS